MNHFSDECKTNKLIRVITVSWRKIISAKTDKNIYLPLASRAAARARARAILSACSAWTGTEQSQWFRKKWGHRGGVLLPEEVGGCGEKLA